MGPQHDYLFVVVKDRYDRLFVNQGHLGSEFVGWEPFKFATVSFQSATAASSGETTAVVAVNLSGSICYSYWDLGQAGSPFYELDSTVLTDAAPAAALVDSNHDYLFVVVQDRAGTLFLNQGHLGREFIGWQPLILVGDDG